MYTWIFRFVRKKILPNFICSKTYQFWQTFYIFWSSRYTVIFRCKCCIIYLSIMSTLMKVKNFWLRGTHPPKDDNVISLNFQDIEQLLHQSWHRKSKPKTRQSPKRNLFCWCQFSGSHGTFQGCKKQFDWWIRSNFCSKTLDHRLSQPTPPLGSHHLGY